MQYLLWHLCLVILACHPRQQTTRGWLVRPAERNMSFNAPLEEKP